jgi:hypothetical protein
LNTRARGNKPETLDNTSPLCPEYSSSFKLYGEREGYLSHNTKVIQTTPLLLAAVKENDDLVSPFVNALLLLQPPNLTFILPWLQFPKSPTILPPPKVILPEEHLLTAAAVVAVVEG